MKTQTLLHRKTNSFSPYFNLFNLFFLLLATGQLQAQFSILDESNVWEEEFEPTAHDTIQRYIHYYLGDTLIANSEYLKVMKKAIHFQRVYDRATPIITVFDTTLQYVAALRGEGNRIFVVFADETEERLLYDFDLEVGDTVHALNPCGSGTPSPITVTYIHENPNGRKNYYLSDGIRVNLLEGIGLTTGLFGSPCSRRRTEIPDLICFTSKDEMIEMNVDYGECNLFDLNPNLTTSSSNLAIEDIAVYPNPFTHSIKVGFPTQGLADAELMVYDILGNLHMRTPWDSDELDLTFLAAGSYLLVCRTTETTWTKRLVKNPTP